MDKQILKRLAAQVRLLADRSIEMEKRNLWYGLNALTPVRPVIFCDPENGWHEIVTDNMLECETQLFRTWEYLLRKKIFWGEHMGDDRVIEPEFCMPYIYTESDWGMHEITIGGEQNGAFTWESPLKSYNDLEKLHPPRIKVDYAATEELLSTAHEIFDGILEVRTETEWLWSPGLSRLTIQLRGLEQFMFDMYDSPNELHRLMQILRNGTLEKLDFLEQHNLLTLNNKSTYIGSGGFGYTNELPQSDFNGHVHTGNMWGFCESQETVSVAPDMFEEFVFQYQTPLLERFGLNCYGCCEPLHSRWHIIKNAPRLRRISVSPWADIEQMAELLEDKYIFSMKPNPSVLAVPHMDEDHVRKNLRKTLETTRGCVVEIIMKDNHTIGNNPENVIRWCKIAQEEVNRICG